MKNNLLLLNIVNFKNNIKISMLINEENFLILRLLFKI